MNAWLDEAAGRLAEAAGEPPDAYALGDAETEALLDLARVAAHDGGARTNAPLLCYLVGLAEGRSREASLADLVRAAAGPGG